MFSACNSSKAGAEAGISLNCDSSSVCSHGSLGIVFSSPPTSSVLGATVSAQKRFGVLYINWLAFKLPVSSQLLSFYRAEFDYTG